MKKQLGNFPLHSALCILHSAFPSRYLSVALSVGLLRLDVIKHRALCSSDFPHHGFLDGATASSAAMNSSIAEKTSIAGTLMLNIGNLLIDLVSKIFGVGQKAIPFSGVLKGRDLCDITPRTSRPCGPPLKKNATEPAYAELSFSAWRLPLIRKFQSILLPKPGEWLYQLPTLERRPIS